jgi:ubiquinone/menaquinone biosynthesis C-methylase UbiE
MQREAYHAMQAMQEHHWWWRGMRHLYCAALAHYSQPNPNQTIVDIGCGFGANLPVLNPLGRVVGVDVSLDALRAIAQRPALGLVQAEADALPFRADTFDIVALLAIIEHAEDDDRVLSESWRVARRGGLQILLTSAFMLLWSHHDEANQHKRRYRTGQMNRLLRAAGWIPVRTSYVNVIVFPAAALIRFIQRHQRIPENSSEYDMGPDLGPLNRVLEGLLTLETWIITHTRLPLPFGVDLFSIGRRRD